MKPFTLELSHIYNASPSAVFKKIEDGTIFRLAGCDDLLHQFNVGGPVAMFFNERGQIFGSYKEIVKNKKVILDWNVSGFDKPDELNTLLEITLEKNGEDKTLLHLINSGISNKDSFEAKKRAWTEILKDLEKEL